MTFIAEQIRSVFFFFFSFCLFSDFWNFASDHDQTFTDSTSIPGSFSVASAFFHVEQTGEESGQPCHQDVPGVAIQTSDSQPTAAARTPLQQVGWRHWVFTNRQKNHEISVGSQMEHCDDRFSQRVYSQKVWVPSL